MITWAVYLILVLAVFGYFENRAIQNGTPTLSRTVWRTEARYPILSFAVGMVIGGLAIHFFGWLPACNP